MAITKRTLNRRGFTHIQVIERGPVPSNMRRAQTRVLKEAWKATAQFHHKENRGKRFTVAGGRELGFRKRTPAYVARKRRVIGHNRPNVWSGRTERQSRIATVTSTSKSARLRYNARLLNFHTGAQELRTISPKEAEQLAGFYARRYEQLLASETT